MTLLGTSLNVFGKLKSFRSSNGNQSWKLEMFCNSILEGFVFILRSKLKAQKYHQIVLQYTNSQISFSLVLIVELISEFWKVAVKPFHLKNTRKFGLHVYNAGSLVRKLRSRMLMTDVDIFTMFNSWCAKAKWWPCELQKM